MLSRYVVYACNAISLMVLTRLFNPEIFGVVAATLTIVTLFQMVAEGGLSPTIINLQDLEVRNRNGIFGLSLLIAGALAITMQLLAPALAHFYNMPQVRQIVPYVAFALFANTAAVLPLAQLQRQQYFKRIAQAGIIAEIGSLGSTLTAYFYLPALHAYALYFPSKAALNFLTNWYYSKETEFGRPIPGAHFSAIKPLLNTTGFQLGFNFVNYFSRNLDSILVGKYLGANMLGVYDRSYRLMRYPLLILTFAMTPAIQPALRGIIHDKNTVSRLHRDLAFKLSVAGSLAAVGVYFFAKYIVLIAFGNQWLSVVPIVKLLALIIPVQTILSTSGSFFQAFNRTDLMFSTGITWTIFNVAAITFGIWKGSLEALCWSLFFSFHVNFLQIYYIMHKNILEGNYILFLKSVWPFIITTSILASISAMNFSF
ncbi:oligosaccharide flippase family protein [Solimonas marina]|uniref:Oligosaccharide flippase family protein n=1 Tax=Solimonas marina TaxID=2714601 RepID=A0A970B845_9GAMM|nr:oligosaccharide flippase family protein [Solimonas marina]NKF21894.1 oligosaccharide flippase family protein [Solimonas marina]